MEGFNSKIVKASRALSARERIMMKDTTDAQNINSALKSGNVEFSPLAWAIVSVHNERSENKDYENLVIIDNNGKKYYTSSPSFREAFMDIFAEMADENGFPIEEYSVKCYAVSSRNQQGCFLTCSIL